MANVSRSPTQDGALQRGKACLSCRRRKMRCDGARPHCTQCIRGNRAEDCEYTDTQGRTRTQVLEEDVARLEARLQELENPDTSTPSVFLHDPYALSRHAGTNSSLANTTTHGFAAPPRPGSVPAVMSWWEFEEPPLQISEMLVREFIPYSQQFGFALNIPRFLASLRLPTLHPSRPHPALLHSIYLWALRMSRTDDLMQHENLYLQRAILALQDALGGGPTAHETDDAAVAMKRVHAIQAEILLSQYFYCLGRFLEGRYHANAGVSLAVSCGLHRITPTDVRSPSGSGYAAHRWKTATASSAGMFDLPPARDAIELGERLNVFWAVYCVDRCWSVAVSSPSTLVDDTSLGTQIDSPWPLDVEEYEMANLSIACSPVLASSKTIQRFLGEEAPQNETCGKSFTALHVKASALFERASRLAVAWNSKASSHNQIQTETQTEMQLLTRIVTHFARSLIPLDQIEARVPLLDARRTLLLLHSLAHGAMIQLHYARTQITSESNLAAINTSLVHAGEITHILERICEDRVEVVNPILGTIWTLATQVFIQESEHMRAAPRTQTSSNRAEALRKNIERIDSALRRAPGFLVLAYQVARIKELIEGYTGHEAASSIARAI